LDSHPNASTAVCTAADDSLFLTKHIAIDYVTARSSTIRHTAESRAQWLRDSVWAGIIIILLINLLYCVHDFLYIDKSSVTM
jgi:hypothetical protein